MMHSIYTRTNFALNYNNNNKVLYYYYIITWHDFLQLNTKSSEMLFNILDIVNPRKT